MNVLWLVWGAGLLLAASAGIAWERGRQRRALPAAAPAPAAAAVPAPAAHPVTFDARPTTCTNSDCVLCLDGILRASEGAEGTRRYEWMACRICTYAAHPSCELVRARFAGREKLDTTCPSCRREGTLRLRFCVKVFASTGTQTHGEENDGSAAGF